MDKRGIGALFCIISTILIVSHYITTAIYLSNTESWSMELFYSGLGYTGYILDILSIISAIVGIKYLRSDENNK